MIGDMVCMVCIYVLPIGINNSVFEDHATEVISTCQMCADLEAEKEELRELLNETRQRNIELNEQATTLTNETEKLRKLLQDIEDQ